MAAAGAALVLDGPEIVNVGIGLTAVGARHFVAAEAEEFLRGGEATDGRFAQAGVRRVHPADHGLLDPVFVDRLRRQAAVAGIAP